MKAAANELKRLWAACAVAAKAKAELTLVEEHIGTPPAPDNAVRSEMDAAANVGALEPAVAAKAEVDESALLAPVAPFGGGPISSSSAGPMKLNREPILSHVTWRPTQPTGDQTRDMVRTQTTLSARHTCGRNSLSTESIPSNGRCARSCRRRLTRARLITSASCASRRLTQPRWRRRLSAA